MGRIYLTAEVSEETGSISLKNEKPLSRDYFLKFIAANPELRTELTAQGEMIVMPPAYAISGHQNADLVAQLCNWAGKDGTGRCFDSSAGFDLPNGANRSPDASWVRKSRLAKLTKAH
jgi:Uma2 family endonuclease